MEPERPALDFATGLALLVFAVALPLSVQVAFLSSTVSFGLVPFPLPPDVGANARDGLTYEATVRGYRLALDALDQLIFTMRLLAPLPWVGVAAFAIGSTGLFESQRLRVGLLLVAGAASAVALVIFVLTFKT